LQLQLQQSRHMALRPRQVAGWLACPMACF